MTVSGEEAAITVQSGFYPKATGRFICTYWNEYTQAFKCVAFYPEELEAVK